MTKANELIKLLCEAESPLSLDEIVSKLEISVSEFRRICSYLNNARGAEIEKTEYFQMKAQDPIKLYKRHDTVKNMIEIMSSCSEDSFEVKEFQELLSISYTAASSALCRLKKLGKVKCEHKPNTPNTKIWSINTPE